MKQSNLKCIYNEDSQTNINYPLVNLAKRIIKTESKFRKLTAIVYSEKNSSVLIQFNSDTCLKQPSILSVPGCGYSDYIEILKNIDSTGRLKNRAS